MELTVVRKWSVIATTSPSPLLVAAGLYLAGIITEPLETLISSEALDAALDVMVMGKSHKWAADQVFGSLSRALATSSTIREIIYKKIIFHSKIFLNEKIKILFFKNFSIKEIFLRTISCIGELDSADDIREVSRICCQIIIAMKVKNGFNDVINEIVLIESERFRTGSSRNGGFLSWLIQAINRVRASDSDAINFLLFMVFEIFLNTDTVKSNPQYNRIQSSISAEIDDENVRKIAMDILSGSKGPKWKPAGVAGDKISKNLTNKTLSMMEEFLESITVPKDQVVVLAEKPIVGESETVPATVGGHPDAPAPTNDSNGGWMDTAANWFLDFAEPESQSEGDKEDAKELEDDDSDGGDEEASEKVSVKSIPVKTVPSAKAPAVIPGPVPGVVHAPIPAAAPKAKTPIPTKPTPVRPVSPMKPGVKVPITKPVGGLVKKPAPAKTVPPAKYPPGKQPSMKKAPPKPAAPQPPPPPPEPEVVEKKEKKSKKKKTEDPTDQSWGDYLGGFGWGAMEEEHTKKKKKKKDSDEDEVVKKPAPVVKPAPKLVPKGPTMGAPKAGYPMSPKALPKGYPVGKPGPVSPLAKKAPVVKRW
jgi:hypothetical protein